MIALVSAIAWVAIAFVTVAFIGLADRSRLGRAVVATVALVTVTGVVVGVWRALDGERLRIVAEDAGLCGLGALPVAFPLSLAWAS